MPAEITMPQLSDTMTEGTLVRWMKTEGDAVKAGEEIAEVETDKATMPYEAPEAGVLAYRALKEGDKAPVGAIIAVIAKKGEDAAQVKQKYAAGSTKAQLAGAPQVPQPAAQSAGATSTKPSSKGVLMVEAQNTAEMKEPDEVGHGATRETPTAVPPLPQRSGNGNERVKASPLARRIAADKHIEINLIDGSGPGGRVVQKDVLAYAARPSGAGASPALALALPARVPIGQVEKLQLTKMRTAIAAALQRSKQNVPHFYETIDVDVEELTRLRERLNQRLEKEKIRLSIGDFVTLALARALKLHPQLNATFDAQNNEITRYGDVNLGIAVALPDGLIVPVLRGVDQMGLKEIRQRSVDIVDRARAQRLKQDELRGATFTVSNLGAYGVREFMAIINPPEVAILAVGAAEKQAVVRGNDQIVPRTMMTLTLSADHRVVDGATAAEFLRTLRGLLEEPASQLL
jgi:pyruvate dehydrogenase E2 component (dihydrolipoamide acetyltransferase)